MTASTYGVILGSIGLIYALMNFKTIVTWMFGETAMAVEGSFAAGVAHLDLVAYLIYTSMVVILSCHSYRQITQPWNVS